MRAKFKLKLTNHRLTLGFHAQPSFPHLPTVNWSQSILRIISLELFLFYELGGSSFLSLIQPGCKPGDICCPSWLRQIFPYNYWYSLQLLQCFIVQLANKGNRKLQETLSGKTANQKFYLADLKNLRLMTFNMTFVFVLCKMWKEITNIWNYDIFVWHPPTLDIGPNFLCKQNLV